MKVHHLNCGTMRVYKQDQAVAVCHCLLIEADHGLVLVDSGIGTADMHEPGRLGPMHLLLNIRRWEEDTALSQVRKMGYSEKDVKDIVITHLDFDHTGGTQDFPWAKVHVSKPEYEAAAHPATFRERQRYRREHLLRVRQWATYDRASPGRWYGLECVRGLDGLPEDIVLIPLMGHTRGHCAVAVRNKGGWLLHAGDAYYHHRQMDHDPGCPLYLSTFQYCAHMRLDQAAQARSRIRSLANSVREEVRVFCTHDPEELAGLSR